MKGIDVAGEFFVLAPFGSRLMDGTGSLDNCLVWKKNDGWGVFSN